MHSLPCKWGLPMGSQIYEIVQSLFWGHIWNPHEKTDTVKPRLSVFQGTSQIYAFKRGYLIGGIGIFPDFKTLFRYYSTFHINPIKLYRFIPIKHKKYHNLSKTMLSEKLVVAEAHCSHIKLSIMEQVWSRQTSDASTPHPSAPPPPTSSPIPRAGERSEQCGESEWVSGASERAGGRVILPTVERLCVCVCVCDYVCVCYFSSSRLRYLALCVCMYVCVCTRVSVSVCLCVFRHPSSSRLRYLVN